MEKIVLSVEDDSSIYLLLQLAFEETAPHFHLVRALDGERALEYLRRCKDDDKAPRPDLILLNLNLPKLDGLGVLDALRTDELLRTIPVVMFTSSDRSEDRANCLARGAKDFISKPLSYDSFLVAVKEACLYAS